MERNKLIAYALKYQGNYDKILTAILKNKEIEGKDVKYCLTILDKEYNSSFPTNYNEISNYYRNILNYNCSF